MDNLCRMYLDYYLAEQAERNPESQVPAGLMPGVDETTEEGAVTA